MFKREQVFASTLEYFQGDALAADVFVNKYCLQDDHGFYETTPQKMHWRLAQEFARPDLKYEFKLDDLPSVKEGWTKSEYYEFYAERVSMYFHLIDRFKFVIPQGSPMSALGNPYQIQSASNCFIPGTEVHTKNGSKPIESVEIGDEVVTHKDRYRKVVQIHKNKLDKRRLYKFKAYRTPFICVTENHEFLSISKEQLGWGMSPQWNSIGYLRVGDYIQIPSNVESAETSQYLDLFSLFKDGFEYGRYAYDTAERVDEKFSLITKYVVGDRSCKKIHKNSTPKKILIDEDFAYFLGLWYGDGCIFGENTEPDKDNSRDRKSKRCTKIRGLTFTLGSHESKIIYFVCSYLEKQGIVFDLNSDLKDGTTQIVIHNGALGYAFEHYFGRRFDGKRLNSFIHSWNKNLVFALLRGLIDSDGTITSAGDIRVVMSNYALLKDIYHLARSYGFLVGFSPTEKSCRLDFGRNSEIRTKSNKEYADTRVSETLSDFTQHTIKIDGKTFVQITSKDLCEEEFEFVYTLGVEEDHSYSVEGLICKNCFVLPSVGDSYSQIMKTDQELAQLSKRRGGVGFDISKLRPEGAPVSNAAKTSSGIVSFMERFSNTTREVGQNGRRAALLMSCSVHHPDIEKFITIKSDRTKVTGANISVAITDEFMKAVIEDVDYEQRWPCEGVEPKIRRVKRARDIWDLIIKNAWENAEPGVIFIDKMRNYPGQHYDGYEVVSTNPLMIAA